VGVERFGEDGRQQWYRFNASDSAREGNRQDEALSKDEAKVANSYSLNGKEVWHGAARVTMSTGGERVLGRGKRRDDTS
jgi:hypothetical protein